MKFQVGDKVIVRHSNEEGEVIDLIDDKMVMVEVKGVRFPAYSDQIDFPYFKRFSEKKAPKPDTSKSPSIDQIKREKGSTSRSYKVDSGVWLAFLPVFDKDVFDDDVVDFFKVYLVNETGLDLDFHYWWRLEGRTDMELNSNIHAFSDFYLQNVPLEQLNDNPRFDFDFSLSRPLKGKATHFEASHKVKPKQLFQKLEDLRLKQEATFSYLLFETYPDEPIQDNVDLSRLKNAGFTIYDASKARQHLEPARTVIDLHIERLTDQWKTMTSPEMLDLQIRTFDKYFELAVLHHQPSLTVIHGVGTGRLRDEIHEILRTKKEVKRFVNQYLTAYGYGATEVYFR
jgi:hypothetical protein